MASRIHRQAGIKIINEMIKHAADAASPVENVFNEGMLADAMQGMRSFGVDPTEAQDAYIQQLQEVYNKYLEPFHGRGAAAEKSPKVISVPK